VWALSQEGAEDDPHLAMEDLKALVAAHRADHVVLVGISCSMSVRFTGAPRHASMLGYVQVIAAMVHWFIGVGVWVSSRLVRQHMSGHSWSMRLTRALHKALGYA